MVHVDTILSLKTILFKESYYIVDFLIVFQNKRVIKIVILIIMGGLHVKEKHLTSEKLKRKFSKYQK